MASFQQVIVMGHLGQDPEVKFMPSGKAVCNLSIATSEKWKDKDTGEDKESTEWHRVTLFERKAEVAGEYLKKGSPVHIVGQLRTRKWQDQGGNDRYTTEIIARNMQMLGGKVSGAGNTSSVPQTTLPPGSQDDFDDDIPF